MSDELREAQKRNLKLMQVWLDSLETVKTVAPLVQQAYEVKQWEFEALGAMPDSATDIPHAHLVKMYSAEQEFWKRNLPPMPNYDEASLAAGTAIAVSSGSATYRFVSRANYLGDPAAQSWSEVYTVQYMHMQGQQQRVDSVRRLLEKLNPDLAVEFDEAVQTYRIASSGWGDTTSVGIALRNVLEHLKGDLNAKAFVHPREQKLKWPEMAARLAKGGTESLESRALTKAEQEWKSLHQRLTAMAKNLKTGTPTLPNVVFPEWVDHLYIVLHLIDPKHYSQ